MFSQLLLVLVDLFLVLDEYAFMLSFGCLLAGLFFPQQVHEVLLGVPLFMEVVVCAVEDVVFLRLLDCGQIEMGVLLVHVLGVLVRRSVGFEVEFLLEELAVLAWSLLGIEVGFKFVFSQARV